MYKEQQKNIKTENLCRKNVTYCNLFNKKSSDFARYKKQESYI